MQTKELTKEERIQRLQEMFGPKITSLDDYIVAQLYATKHKTRLSTKLLDKVSLRKMRKDLNQ